MGHTFTAESLLEEQRDRLEDALWIAVRALDEQALTAGRLAERSRERGMLAAAQRFEARQRGAAVRADVVRSAVRSVALDAAEGAPRDVRKSRRRVLTNR